MEAPSEICITQDCLSSMDNDGVVVINKLMSSEQVEHLKNEVINIHDIIISKISNLPRPLRTYSDIAERQPGRLDFRCGFKAPLFNEVSKPIIRLIKEMSPTIDFRHYWGAIPTQGGSGPTDMHRDIYTIQNNMRNQDIGELDLQLPPYYFTVLIPLMQMTKTLGPTEFIKGSHRKNTVDIGQEEIFSPILSPGDIVIFEGRTLHRGAANQTQDVRLIAYITFIANWYHDQTFAINDYLFPDLF